MESEKTKSLYEKVFWIKIAISIFLGIMSYYSLDSAWPFGDFFLDVYLIVMIHFLIVTMIPFLIIRLKTKSGFVECLSEAIKTIRTQTVLFFLVGGLTFMVNI